MVDKFWEYLSRMSFKKEDSYTIFLSWSVSEEGQQRVSDTTQNLRKSILSWGPSQILQVCIVKNGQTNQFIYQFRKLVITFLVRLIIYQISHRYEMWFSIPLKQKNKQFLIKLAELKPSFLLLGFLFFRGQLRTDTKQRSGKSRSKESF